MKYRLSNIFERLSGQHIIRFDSRHYLFPSFTATSVNNLVRVRGETLFAQDRVRKSLNMLLNSLEAGREANVVYRTP